VPGTTGANPTDGDTRSALFTGFLALALLKLSDPISVRFVLVLLVYAIFLVTILVPRRTISQNIRPPDVLFSLFSWWWQRCMRSVRVSGCTNSFGVCARLGRVFSWYYGEALNGYKSMSMKNALEDMLSFGEVGGEPSAFDC
jgi:hypothetical protein